MARILVKFRGDRYWITLSGSLRATDLGRLEQACGTALESPQAPLTLELRGVTDVDEVARRFLHRLEERGAVLRQT